MTLTYFSPSALLENGWEKDVLLTVDEHGWITDVQSQQSPGSAIQLHGPLLPGMPNVHSHAFQRAMAGLAEYATGKKDSFWSWRETMYKFLVKLTPEDQQVIAAQVYVEMLKTGYTSVGEFHYLHHQSGGQSYDEPGLTSKMIIEAAKRVGLSITHLPVLYVYSGFGDQAPNEIQKRFVNNEEQILSLIESLCAQYKHDPQVSIGFAHHSIRAVSPAMLLQVTAAVKKILPHAALHIHAAEQKKEVEDCLANLGKRPVEWLLENVALDANWCLIHATHMTAMERQQLAKSGAVIGLCPTTEANLGDGIFDLSASIENHQVFGIGSDSQISVNMIEELRWLEYGQRLFHQRRIIAASDNQPSAGGFLYRHALAGGAQALQRKTGKIAKGMRADFIVLDHENPSLFYRQDDLILDSMIFAANTNTIRHVFAGGVHVVKDFHHVDEEKILADYRATLKRLLNG